MISVTQPFYTHSVLKDTSKLANLQNSLVTWGSQGHGARSGNSDSCFPPFDHTPMFFVVLGDRCPILQSKIPEQKLIFLMIGMVDFQTQEVKSFPCVLSFLAEFISLVREDLFCFFNWTIIASQCLFLLKMRNQL